MRGLSISMPKYYVTYCAGRDISSLTEMVRRVGSHRGTSALLLGLRARIPPFYFSFVALQRVSDYCLISYYLNIHVLVC